MLEGELNDNQLQQIYNWVDEVPLSRPKRNMPRDFSDAVLFAQMIAYYNPKIVQLHNYVATGSLQQKLNNWKTLNRKVLNRLKLPLNKQQIDGLAGATPGMIQQLISRLKKSIENGDLPTPTVISKNTSQSFAFRATENKPAPYNKMSYKQIKTHKSVRQLVNSKDEQINLLKNQIQLLLNKSSKLQIILKIKDKEIQQMVKMIKINKKQ